MVNYKESIKKPFTDLTKLVIGIVLSFIPIVQWIVKGFALESSGLGKTRPSPKMPEWKNFVDLFIKGLLADIISFVYMLPAIIVFLLAIGVGLIPFIYGMIGSTALQQFTQTSQMSGKESELLKNLIMQNWHLLIPSLIVAAPILLVAFVLFLFAIYVGPIAVLNYVKNNKFTAAFDFNIIFRKTMNVKYFVVWIVTLVLIAIISAVLSWIPFIGRAIAYFLIAVISFSLYGQIFREIK
jgi:hypothetical protein